MRENITPEKLNSMFEELAVSLGIPEDKIGNMMLLTSDNKQRMIEQYSDRIVEDSVLAEKCVVLLERGKLRLEEARELRIAMRTCNKTVIDKFYRRKGFELMHDVSEYSVMFLDNGKGALTSSHTFPQIITHPKRRLSFIVYQKYYSQVDSQ